MALYELHACRNGIWKRLEAFESRDAAMSAVIKLEHDPRYSGAKVLKETYDEDRRTFHSKLIHKWSEDFQRQAKDRNYAIFTATAISAVTGAVTLMMVLRAL